MWKRFASALRCPLCRGGLKLESFVEETATPGGEQAGGAAGEPDSGAYVVDGQLLCEACRVRYPILRGLPVMLPYTTPLHEEFRQKYAGRLQSGFNFAARPPAPGEDFVRASFSTEWLNYDYDGVIWELSYADHEVRFRKEVGDASGGPGWFLEVGCGLGLATSVAQSLSSRDCVGMDLSLAVTKAAEQFRSNPRMHFVQASAFAPPFADSHFDLMYSRGVLHHTYSTQKAFEKVAPLCKPTGTFFLWLYGPGSIRSTPLRIVLFALEAVTRPIVSRAPDSALSKLFLGTMSLGYMLFNRLRRLTNPEIQPLSFSRGVHAARDRFTPKYAHRHSAQEICSWFQANGFGQVQVLDWRAMPPADQDDFRRNVGVRGVRTAQAR